jgi:tetratricopeptide (TPR) repeat protein
MNALGGSMLGLRLTACLALTVMAVLCFGGYGNAAADEDTTAARAAYKSGVHHYDFGEYREALADFKTAYQHHEDPSFLFNIAQCHRQLGEREEAVRVYRSYLRNAPDAANASEVRQMIARLEQQIETTNSKPPVAPAQSTSPMLERSRDATPRASPILANPNSPAVSPAHAATTGKPIYKRWWLWTVVGVAAAGVAVGAGIALAPGPSAPSVPTTTGTTLRF